MEERYKEMLKKISKADLFYSIVIILLFALCIRACSHSLSEPNTYTVYESKEMIKKYETENNFLFSEWRKEQLTREIISGAVYSDMFADHRAAQIETLKNKSK